MSTAGHQAGTPAYMAPECFDGGKGVSEKVDVFAFAVLLWEVRGVHRPLYGCLPAPVWDEVMLAPPAACPATLSFPFPLP